LKVAIAHNVLQNDVVLLQTILDKFIFEQKYRASFNSYNTCVVILLDRHSCRTII